MHVGLGHQGPGCAVAVAAYSLLFRISGRRCPPAAPLKPPGLHLRPVYMPPGTAGSLGSGSRFFVLPWQGLIKIRGDQCWRDLTCMDFHYEVSCMVAADPAPCPCLPGPGAPAPILQAQASRRPQLSSWRPLLFALLSGHRQVTWGLTGHPVCWAGGGGSWPPRLWSRGPFWLWALVPPPLCVVLPRYPLLLASGLPDMPPTGVHSGELLCHMSCPPNQGTWTLEEVQVLLSSEAHSPLPHLDPQL